MAPSAGVLLLCALVARPAVRLTWDAPTTCPDGASVDARIVRYLGPAEASANAGAPEARVRVTRVGGKYQAQMETRSEGRTGVRTLEADTCEELASATALIIAMIVDPNAVRGAPPAPVAPPPPVAEVVHAPVPAPPRRALSFTIGGAAAAGALPNSSLGLAAFASMSVRAWEVGVAGRLWPSSAVALDADAGGSFARSSVGVRLLRTSAAPEGRPRLSARAGIGLDVVRISARGYGVSDPGRDAFVGVEPVASIGASLALSRRLRLQADLEAATAVRRPRFTLLDRGTVWTLPAASATFALGLSYVL